MKFIKTHKKDLIYCGIIALLAFAALALGIALANKKSEEAQSYYYDKKCEVFAMENSNFSRGQIVFIGDSITDGCALDTYYGALDLAAYNRGIGGDTTAGVLKRLDSSLIALEPSKVVLLIGINDINGGVKKEEIIDNYDKILKKISESLPSADVICVSILPLNDDLESYTGISVAKSTETILAVNPEIEKLAEKYGYDFVDMFSVLADEENRLPKKFSPDGIHLSDAGYREYSTVITLKLCE